jgi:hypothetical protein
MNSPFTRAMTLVVLVLAVAACTPIAPANNVSNNTTEPLVSTDVDTTEVETEQPEEQQDFAARLTFTEGERIELATLATDPDNDDVDLEFSRPFDRNGVWNTQVGDAGDYPVTVIARDNRGAETTQRILVTILFANRAPVIVGPDSIAVREGETIALDFTGSDPDEDEVLISYAGWMKGHTYTTSYDDAGEHTVTVIAEDGQLETRKDVTVTVENVNRAPVLSTKSETYELTEGQTLTINPVVEDPDGDNVAITFGEPLDAMGRWTPVLGDAGEYTVEITADDGSQTSVEQVLITVLRANRAPTVGTASGDNKLYVNEGDFVDLREMLIFEDEENEDITATYSGWMRGPTYQTTYTDAGEHTVTVTATDAANHTVRQDVIVVVRDVNRAPVFIRPA